MARKFTVKTFGEKWEQYKKQCDGKRKPVYGFSPQKLEFVEASVRSPVPYDLKGFFAFIGLSKQAFYKTYYHDPAYEDLIQLIELQCENSKREGFEQGTVPPQLAGLWMSRYEDYGERDSTPEDEEQDDPLSAALREEAARLANQR